MGNNLSIQRALMATAAVIIILAGVKLAAKIVVPFLLALFIAIICSPIIKAMTKRRVPQGLAITLLLVLIVGIFFFLIGLISNTANEFTQSIPQYRELLSQRIADIVNLAQQFNIPLHISKDSLIEQLDPSILMNFVSQLLLGFSGVVSNAFVLILVVIFMLMEAPTFKHKFALAISHQPTDVHINERSLDRVLQSIVGYLGVKTLTSLMTGACVWILLQSLNVQYAILWATLSVLFNYIPSIGSIIAAVPIIVQSFLLNGFAVGFGVMAGLVVLNVAIGLLEPKLMGKRLGLSVLVVFLSLLFWGWLLGTVGMLLSVPLTMAIKIALEASPNTKKYAVLLGSELPTAK